MMNPDITWPNPNAYLRMLVAALPDDIEVVRFGWRAALAGRYDIFHAHWPEHMAGGRLTWLRVRLQVAFLLLIVANRIRRIPMVWTVHNIRPHEPADLSRRLGLRAWSAAVSRRIYLYAAAMPPGDAKGVVIRHGDYSPLYPPRDARPASPSGLLTFGLVRRYKGIEGLLSALRRIPESQRPSAVIAGAPIDAAYVRELTAGGLAGARFDLRDLPDRELQSLIEDAAHVVLPYRRVYNSGAAILSLTLRRPILVPESPTMLELAALVGGGWVRTYRGQLDPDDILSALGTRPTTAEPDLSALQWPDLGRQHADLYRGLVARKPRLN